MLDHEGFSVICTAETDRVVELCREVNFDIVICDLYMGQKPGVEGQEQIAGLDLIWSLKGRFPRLPLIAMSGLIGKDSLRHLKKGGVNGILPKPFNRENLLGEILSALCSAEHLA